MTESGREFQIAGPADLKPREPKTELTCGTQRRCALEERRARGGTYGRMRDDRYDGAMAWSDLKVSRAILK